MNLHSRHLLQLVLHSVSDYVSLVGKLPEAKAILAAHLLKWPLCAGYCGFIPASAEAPQIQQAGLAAESADTLLLTLDQYSRGCVTNCQHSHLCEPAIASATRAILKNS